MPLWITFPIFPRKQNFSNNNTDFLKRSLLFYANGTRTIVSFARLGKAWIKTTITQTWSATACDSLIHVFTFFALSSSVQHSSYVRQVKMRKKIIYVHSLNKWYGLATCEDAVTTKISRTANHRGISCGHHFLLLILWVKLVKLTVIVLQENTILQKNNLFRSYSAKK